MAGEIEDSYSFSFQAGSIHSGSISFGRFESEPLSWERRSSFSHNRYLEEVERYSKPGSVNEKKAYFEAHFRKKLRSQQSISDEQTSMEHHSNEHNLSESTDDMEVVQLANKDGQSCHFDESPVSSEYGGEHEVSSNRVQESRTAKSPVEIDVTIDIVAGEVAAETEMNKAKGPESNQKEKEVSSQVISLSRDNDTSEITIRTDKKRLPTKMADAVELEPRNATPKSQPTVAPEDSQKNPSRRIGITSPKTSRERPSWAASCTATSSVRGMRKSDDKNSGSSKGMPKSRSVGESKGKKFTESSPLAMNKIESRGASTGCRLGRREESKKPNANPRTGISSFKSNERTETRKEFYMKSEDKIHAKKVEISQIAARAQGRTEAEIKQFRRSLPTPMPSFDHTDGNKSARTRRANQTRLSNESPGLLKQSALRSPPHSKPGNRLLSSASDVTKLTGPLNVASDSVSTAGAVNGKKGVRTVNVQGATRSRIMNNEMPRRGIRTPGLSRTGHVAVIGVAS